MSRDVQLDCDTHTEVNARTKARVYKRSVHIISQRSFSLLNFLRSKIDLRLATGVTFIEYEVYDAT